MEQHISLGLVKPSTPAQPGATTNQDIEPPARDQAQLNMTQTLEMASKLLKSFWEMQEWKHSQLAEEFKKLQQQSDEFKKREQAVATHLTDADNKLKASQNTLETVTKEKEEVAKKEAAAQDKLKDAATADASAKAALEQVEKLHDQIRDLERQLWPPSLSGDAWSEWRSKLQENVVQRASAGFVIAAIYRFRAAEKADDPMEVPAALQELGRRLYSETSDLELVAKIGTALNEASAGKFQLRFARVGEPTAAQWMNYQPGLGSVARVRNWAVFKPNATGDFQIASKADVQ